MKIILFDGEQHESLLPLTFTRPVADLRIGMDTIRQKWQRHFDDVGVFTQDYLMKKYPLEFGAEKNLLVRAAMIPDNQLIDTIMNLRDGFRLHSQGQLIAARVDKANELKGLNDLAVEEYAGQVMLIDRPYDLFRLNGAVMEEDFKAFTSGRQSQALDASNTIIGDHQHVFVEKGAQVWASVINTTTGPVYIGKDAEVMEGCTIRGGLYLGEHATLKMGAKIYGSTTIGPHCKIGGEVSNSIFQGHSNKGHDGFVGNSVVGEWCNLGADTNTSNLKNNYSHVRVWNYVKADQEDAGVQFCGTIMGDHSRTGINTMLNTGTVTGIFANIFGGGFPPKFIPSFSWGGADGIQEFDLPKAFEAAERMMERRGLFLSEEEKAILTIVHQKTAGFRKKADK